jgi:hypothetical protein
VRASRAGDRHHVDPGHQPIGRTKWRHLCRRHVKDRSTYIHCLHALDVTSGAEVLGGPQTLAASGFVSKQYEERSALLLLNGMIITSWTSHCDAGPYNGWIMSYNASTLAQTSAVNTTPNGSGGAFWMAGAGPAADSVGNIYLLAGNGTFDTTLDGSGFPSHGDFGNAAVQSASARRGRLLCDVRYRCRDL